MSKLTNYIADRPVYTGGELYPAGTPFVSDAEPGEGWEKITPKEAAANEAATNRVPDDADLEALSKAALQAVAFVRHVPGIKGLDEKGLKDAIRASYEPAL